MAFAITEQVAARLGRSLTEAEEAMVEALIEAATALIADAAGRDDAWAEALDPVPNLIKIVCVELVNRTMANPQALSTFQESLGAYSQSQRFRDGAAGGGLELTAVERRLIRRTVWGQLSGSATVESVVDDLYCLS